MKRRIRVNRSPGEVDLYAEGFTKGHAVGEKKMLITKRGEIAELKATLHEKDARIDYLEKKTKVLESQIRRTKQNQGKPGTNADRARKRRIKASGLTYTAVDPFADEEMYVDPDTCPKVTTHE